MNFPLEKYDTVFVPTLPNSLGMENFGCTIIGESEVFAGVEMTVDDKIWQMTLILHELAH